MAQAKRTKGQKVNSNINVTPMVDVMLVLLIVFMVITPMLQKGVSVDLAKTEAPTQWRMPIKKTRCSSPSRAMERCSSAPKKRHRISSPTR